MLLLPPSIWGHREDTVCVEQEMRWTNCVQTDICCFFLASLHSLQPCAFWAAGSGGLLSWVKPALQDCQKTPHQRLLYGSVVKIKWSPHPSKGSCSRDWGFGYR